MEPTALFLSFNGFGRRAEEAWDMVLSKLPLRDDCEEATRRFGQIPSFRFWGGELLQRAHLSNKQDHRCSLWFTWADMGNCNEGLFK